MFTKKAISLGLLTLSLGLSSAASAADVQYSDPAPNANDGGCYGISYEWTILMNGKDEASFVGHVGAKSWNEPPPSYEPPLTGWTHTSHWVALRLENPSLVMIEVERQEGVAYSTSTGMRTARNQLVPAFSIYRHWDNTSCDEEHRYDNAGNFDWSTVEYIANRPNHSKTGKVKHTIKLPAGEYSIAIGGDPATLEVYPPNNCDATADAQCYAYTGRHGYRANIKTFPVKMRNKE